MSLIKQTFLEGESPTFSIPKNATNLGKERK